MKLVAVAVAGAIAGLILAQPISSSFGVSTNNAESVLHSADLMFFRGTITKHDAEERRLHVSLAQESGASNTVSFTYDEDTRWNTMLHHTRDGIHTKQTVTRALSEEADKGQSVFIYRDGSRPLMIHASEIWISKVL